MIVVKARGLINDLDSAEMSIPNKVACVFFTKACVFQQAVILIGTTQNIVLTVHVTTRKFRI